MVIDTAFEYHDSRARERNVSGGPKGRHSIAMTQEYQPEGLSDSSRWSKHSGDHRITKAKEQHPGGVLEKKLAPRRGAIQKRTAFRWSSLRSDHRLLSFNPPG
jgi:hypothetical protein